MTLVAALIAGAIALTGFGAANAAMPDTFVAVSAEAGVPGVTVYASATGRALRRLSRGDRDGQPMLSADRRWVYYVGPAASGGCDWQLWRVPLLGGRPEHVAAAGEPGAEVAVSRGGRLLAYTAPPPGPCGARAGNTAVNIVDLRTGRRHRIDGEVTGLAWDPSGALAVVTPVAPTAAGRIRLISDPFRARRVTAGVELACPTRLVCGAQSPSFDGRGDLFYLAVIPPRAGNSCWFGVCFGWTYAIVSVSGPRTHVLTSVVRRDAIATSAEVDESGTAVIFTLPQSNGHPRVWRWSSGARPSPVRAPGAFSAQPAW
jgi:hypothetical protein